MAEETINDTGLDEKEERVKRLTQKYIAEVQENEQLITLISSMIENIVKSDKLSKKQKHSQLALSGYAIGRIVSGLKVDVTI